jgi:FkbM family methyltransferase
MNTIRANAALGIQYCSKETSAREQDSDVTVLVFCIGGKCGSAASTVPANENLPALGDWKVELTATLRKVLLPVLQRVNLGDITIRHHWTRDRIRLHSFTHKGYWFHGRDRNRKLLEKFRSLVANGDCVLDLGGHIGYTALFFSSLVGSSGHVYVFEPSPENLRYLRRNVDLCARTNMTVVESAASDKSGWCALFSDSETGQNSTIVTEFRSEHLAPDSPTFSVRTTTVDEFVGENKIRPGFIKIDTEGAEAQILKGMKTTLRDSKPRMLIEISLNVSEVLNLLATADYQTYTDSGLEIRSADQLAETPYVFAFHATDTSAAARLQA